MGAGFLLLFAAHEQPGRGLVRFRFKLFGRERGESHSHEDAELPYCCPVLDLLIPGNWKNVVMKLWQAGLQTMGERGAASA